MFPGMCAHMRLSYYGGNGPEVLVSVVIESVVGLRELGWSRLSLLLESVVQSVVRSLHIL